MVFIRNKPFTLILIGVGLILTSMSIEYGSRQSQFHKQLLDNLVETSNLEKATNDAETGLMRLPHPLERPTTYMYILGWLFVMYSMGIKHNVLKYNFNKKGLLAIVGSLTIIGGVLITRLVEHEGLEVFGLPDNDPRKYAAPTLFIGGWLLIAWLSALKHHSTIGFRSLGKLNGKLGMSLLGVGLILGSTLGMLPIEREANITDSFGSYMLALGWLAVATSNAMFER